jgi:hypothetical protein
MSKQRNVQQQNALTRQGIVEAASRFAEHSPEMAWLDAVLYAHGLDRNEGILAELREVPAQKGRLVHATWLTHDGKFWEVVVLLSHDAGELTEVEEFRDMTDSIPVRQHMPGTGASFGWLALQILEETRGAARDHGE